MLACIGVFSMVEIINGNIFSNGMVGNITGHHNRASECILVIAGAFANSWSVLCPVKATYSLRENILFVQVRIDLYEYERSNFSDRVSKNERRRPIGANNCAAEQLGLQPEGKYKVEEKEEAHNNHHGGGQEGGMVEFLLPVVGREIES
jgi:hypothetical protein